MKIKKYRYNNEQILSESEMLDLAIGKRKAFITGRRHSVKLEYLIIMPSESVFSVGKKIFEKCQAKDLTTEQTIKRIAFEKEEKALLDEIKGLPFGRSIELRRKLAKLRENNL